MDISSLLVFGSVLFIAAGSPGPSIAALVGRVLAKGMRGVFPFLAAMWIGEAIWLGCAVFGLAFVAETFHLAFLVIKYAGVVYLLYLAWKMWTAPTDAQESELPKADSPLRLFLTGLAVTLGNPKIMMFYLALLPSIIDLASVTILGWAELTLAMVIVLVIVDFAWIAAAAQTRRLLKNSRAMRIANRASASIMAGAAAAIATR
ncbi:threonine/homoserine/homoserine lactone efflux protein [Mesorhizobium sp. J18]|uniref:LysE family translocator n=1 Tax=Mesorhizobium sp. J18 TaxID=935263 RepID=UPI00119B37C1|nr:LysE family translocator [Mesorhizobium sp. J18]TWG89048.1 threonine/homoserine/homoserine lactone efflux protein [Mesorhizobium sp. J18]